MRTPSQTVGPFFEFGLLDRPANEVGAGSISLSGQVFDGSGEPVSDALIELWHPAVGFGRAGTDAEGRFRFTVAEPPGGYFEVMVFARGLLRQVVTRVYFPGASDDFLESLDERARATLLAVREDEGSLRFDVHLQGEGETAFFAV